jgi:hypothetical protein
MICRECTKPNQTAAKECGHNIVPWSPPSSPKYEGMVIFLFFASPNCVHHKLPTIQFYRLSRKYPSREPIPLNDMVFIIIYR